MEKAETNQIVLTTLNARYMHAAFGLRYLYANLAELQSSACIEEFTIQQRPIDIVEKLLNYQPKIIGFGVYIWNVSEVTKTVELIKQISPETVIVLGGPEVSHLPDKDRKSTRLNSSHQIISYAVFCLKKKKYERGQECKIKYINLTYENDQ